MFKDKTQWVQQLFLCGTTFYFSVAVYQSQYFLEYFKQLAEAKEADRDAYIEKLGEFSSLIYSNLEGMKQVELAQAIAELRESILTVKRNSQSLYSDLILILNDIFDAFPIQEMEDPLIQQFELTLAQLEKLIKSNLSILNMESLTNASYYFCKFQYGDKDFWEMLEQQIIKSKDSLTISQLAKILLSLAMNNKRVQDQVWKDILDSILSKIDKAEVKDTFYICMALGGGRIIPQVINTDLYYTLYLNSVRHISEFDLYQLSQLSMFLASPQAARFVPDTFWTDVLSKELLEALENYNKFEGKINSKVYFNDFLRALASFGIRSVGGKQFLTKIEEFFSRQLQNLGGKMCENLLFFMTRLNTENPNLIKQILNRVEQEKFIEQGEFNDFQMLVNIQSKYKIDVQPLLKQFDIKEVDDKQSKDQDQKQ
ncbi:UNKNOWN [Stylonychia lemnae]|uniref:Transmembrane protein n=1 Tax=Stylonychia lemnae TaxID=5949 RepID=A0A077ZZL5_STYLE|nr:UNKNOWN [Stylonychia lemnae]|eukprot:CDW74678.1 UNKNOWN [Stylonychia lemnae]